MIKFRFAGLFLLACLLFVQCKNKKETDPATKPTTGNLEKPVDKPSRPDKAVDKLYPTDDAKLDPAFQQFRGEMITAVQSKDLGYLLQHLDEGIDLGKEKEKGKDAFMAQWDLSNNPDQSELWGLMSHILDNGGSFNMDKSIFTAPYYVHLPEEYDPLQYGVVIGKKVRLRGAPNKNAKLVGELTHDIVELLELDENAKVEETIGGDTYYWEKIKTLDGREGYVYGKYLKKQSNYKLNFNKVKDDWRITSLK